MSSRGSGALKTRIPLYLVSVLALAAGPSRRAHAETEGASAVSAAFNAMMARPSDPDLAVRYARIAAANGQTRAAIAALERVLRLDPALDNIRLALASLYYAENNPTLASVYAKQALTAEHIPQNAAEQGRALVSTASRAASPSKLEASVFTGLRYDSDANQATSLPTIGVFSPLVGNVQVPTPVRASSDWSSVVTLQLSHSYDLGLQRDGAWETNLSGFDQRFFHINHRYDLEAVTADTGPRIGFGPTDSIALSARPFATVTWLGYGDQTFAWLYGGGATLQARIGRRWGFNLTGTTRFGSYQNSDFRGAAELYTGVESSVAGTITYAVTSSTRAVLAISYYHANAHADFDARSGPGASVALVTEQTIGTRPVALSVHAGIQGISYRAADPLFGLPDRRRDPVTDAGLAAAVPIIAHLKAVAEYDFTKDNSNYPAYRFSDHSITFGLRWEL